MSEPEYEQLELPFDPPLESPHKPVDLPAFPPPGSTFFPENPLLERRISDLEARVHILETTKPGRRGVPVQVSEPGVCGLDPDCDSSKCEKASVYRWQKGCRGTACENEYRSYYSAYRKKKRGTENAILED